MSLDKTYGGKKESLQQFLDINLDDDVCAAMIQIQILHRKIKAEVFDLGSVIDSSRWLQEFVQLETTVAKQPEVHKV